VLRYSAGVNTAVIDIGTNTLLLLIIDENLKRVVDLCRFGRLGKGLDASGNLDPEAIARSLDICREYRAVMDAHLIDAPAIIATQALREAKNAAAFVEPAEEILRAKIEVIAGTREAELAFLSVARTFPELAGTPYVVVDVGGGSTELIVTDGKQILSATSVPIGAVRLTERHLKHDPPTADEIAALEADIDRHLAPLDLPQGVPLIGTAGTATTIGAAQLALTTYDPDAVTGLRLAPGIIEDMRARLLAATVAARKGMPGIEVPRADVIAAGVAIYARTMHRMQASVMITCDRGIRWGLAFERGAK
jgi:exopolyphosphatase/guanosine-5'-triphosphate,3'-diphosphate pyrophosphatase